MDERQTGLKVSNIAISGALLDWVQQMHLHNNLDN